MSKKNPAVLLFRLLRSMGSRTTVIPVPVMLVIRVDDRVRETQYDVKRQLKGFSSSYSCQHVFETTRVPNLIYTFYKTLENQQIATGDNKLLFLSSHVVRILISLLYSDKLLNRVSSNSITGSLYTAKHNEYT